MSLVHCEMPPKYEFKISDIVNSKRIDKDNLHELQVWRQNQNLSFLSDEQLVLFLLCSNNIVEDAQRVAEKYFKYRTKSPELFSGMDMEGEDMRKTTTLYNIAASPKRTPNNDVVLVAKLKNTSYANFHLDKLVKLAFMVVDYCLVKNPPNGLISVIDMEGVGLFHLTKMRIGIVQKFLQYVQEGLPCQIKQVHVLNTVSFIDKFLFIIKPFIKKELFEMIKFHHRGADLTKIFEDIPKSCLPEDYGGSLAPLEILSCQTYEEMKQLTPFYSDIEEQVKLFERVEY